MPAARLVIAIAFGWTACAGAQAFPADPMAGTRANCQNCHRRAAYPAFDPKVPGSADFGHVYNDGYRSPNDPYFARLLKVDFMWSIALKNVAP